MCDHHSYDCKYVSNLSIAPHSRIPKLRQKQHKRVISNPNPIGGAQVLPHDEKDVMTDDGKQKHQLCRTYI